MTHADPSSHLLPPHHIIHILHSGAIGGGSRMVYGLASHFNTPPWQSTVIVSPDGPLGPDLRAAGVGVIELDLTTISKSMRATFRMTKLLSTLPLDIVHLHGQFAGFFGGMAARLAQARRVIYTAHFPSFMTDWDLYRRVRNDIAERVTCRCADQLVCVSSIDREEYIRRRLVSGNRTVTIHNGVDLSQFEREFDTATLRQRLGLSPDVAIVGYVGRLADQKGVEYLMRATPTVLAQAPNTHVLIVGDGPLRPQLEAVARQLGLTNHVTFTGVRRDIEALMAITQMVVVPSLFEPFGIVALEAMAAGKPVVASGVDGLTKLVVHGWTGFLVPPADTSMLANAIITLLTQAELRSTMGQAGRARAREHFSLAKMYQSYEQVYSGLL